MVSRAQFYVGKATCPAVLHRGSTFFKEKDKVVKLIFPYIVILCLHLYKIHLVRSTSISIYRSYQRLER